MSASMVPSDDITIESSRSSSSSSSAQILPPYCSPSASIRIAARSGPVSLRPSACRLSAGQGGPDFAVGRGRCALSPRLAVRSRMHVGFSPVYAVASCSHWRMIDNGFVRVALGEVADLLHRLGVHLALHLGDVDHLRGVVRRCATVLRR